MNFTHNTSLNPTFLQLFFVAKDLFLCPSAGLVKLKRFPVFLTIPHLSRVNGNLPTSLMG